jgi:pyruvate formate lyase activating enzyme
VQCNICEKGCNIIDGKIGFCGHYLNKDGHIQELYPNRFLQAGPILIETMPMLHFFPGNRFLQITTTGCNFNCSGCISSVIVQQMNPASPVLHNLSPTEVVNEALEQNCLGITFILNDPIVSFTTFLNIARQAKSKGLLVGCSSNAYFTESALEEILPYLDFMNIGMKGISDKAYQNCGVSSIKPVLRNIKTLYNHGVHLEISCMYRRDNREEVVALAHYLAGISPEIPLQVMRFIPFAAADISQEPSINEAEKLCSELKGYLNYVYLFNSAGSDYINTFCPVCGELIVSRDFYGPMGARNRLFGLNTATRNGKNCPGCGHEITYAGYAALPEKEEESTFTGGYPFTRSLEMIEAILISIGLKDKKKLIQVWEEIIKTNGFQQLYNFYQNLDSYIETICQFGYMVGEEEKANKLALYMKNKVDYIRQGVQGVTDKPRVYYCMGKPLFCIKGERLENQLVEAAGGISINQDLVNEGRPGQRVEVERINALNPEYIFTSTFNACSLEDFYQDCITLGLDVDAVKNKKIYAHPAPGWDFGSPRWILGLMNIANILHPDIFHFDLKKEAQNFYQQFYGIDFVISEINRSFSRPHRNWDWN